jgi:hypothetical protein
MGLVCKPGSKSGVNPSGTELEQPHLDPRSNNWGQVLDNLAEVSEGVNGRLISSQLYGPLSGSLGLL